MAKLYRRKRSPYWWVSYYDAQGKRQQVTSRKTDKRAAEIWAAAQEVQSSREAAGAPGILRRRLDPAVAEFLEEKRPIWSAHWYRTCVYWWNATLLPELGLETEVDAVSQAMVSGMRSRLLTQKKKKVKPATVNRLTACGSAFFKWAIRKSYASSNPFKGHEHLREPKSPPPFLDDKAIRRFLSKLPNGLRQAATVAVDTGLRRSELARLRWDDLRPEVPAVIVKSTYEHGLTKTGRLREVPLTPRALKAIRAMPKGKGPIFGEMPVAATRTIMRAAQDAAKVPRFRWHDLRHFALTRAAEAGAGGKELKELAGWGSLAMADRYVHPSRERLLAVMKRLG